MGRRTLGGVRADHRHGFLPRVGGSESPDLSWAMPLASQVFLVSSFPGRRRRSKNDQFNIPAHKIATLRLRWSMDSPYSVSDNQQKMKLSRTFLATAEFHCPYSNLKGHSCKRCLSNYVLDFDLNMQKQVSIWSWVIFSWTKKSWPWCFFGRKNPVLPCKSANSTVARFSQYQPCNLHSEFPINARSWVPNWWILWGDGPSGGFVQTIAMASCPGSVEARAQIYLEQCPLHLKFSWSQVFLEGEDDQRTISLTFLRTKLQLWGFDGLWTVRILFRQSAKDEALQDFSCHWWLDSLPRRFLRRMGHGMLRDWNMDKVHETCCKL